MDNSLRPLTLGEILDRTAQLYRSNFLLFSGIFAGVFALYHGVALIFTLSQAGVPPAVRARIFTDPAQAWRAILFIGVELLLMFVLYGLASAAITRAVAWVHLGEPATIRAAYRSVLPHLARFLGLKLLTAIIVFAVWLGSLIGVVIVGALAAVALRGAAVVIILPLYLAAFVLPVIVALRYSLAMPACVVENLGVGGSMRRSVQLSKGSRGRIFLLWLLVAAVEIAVLLCALLFFILYPAAHQGQMPIYLTVLQQFVAFLANSVVAPILATGSTLFYFDQRVRQEGYDIEWMMQAAGMTPPLPGDGPVSGNE
ncbi:MAG: hypothetical protein WCE75_00470 [Terracidiphilus sp.]